MYFKKIILILLAAIAGFSLQTFYTSAHSTAIYSGTHLVDFDMHPRSPFPGEKTRLTFKLFDLRYSPPQEDFVLSSEILEAETKAAIYAREPEIASGGLLEFDYTFKEPGFYAVQFFFNRQGEPDIVRDATFYVEVRNAPGFGAISFLAAALFGIVGFFIGKFFPRKT